MRNMFLPGVTKEEAREAAPWASVIIEVEGGWHAFESIEDYNIFMKQI